MSTTSPTTDRKWRDRFTRVTGFSFTAIVMSMLFFLLVNAGGYYGVFDSSSVLSVKLVLVAFIVALAVWLYRAGHFWRSAFFALVVAAIAAIGRFGFNMPDIDISGGPIIWAIAVVILGLGAVAIYAAFRFVHKKI